MAVTAATRSLGLEGGNTKVPAKNLAQHNARTKLSDDAMRRAEMRIEGQASKELSVQQQKAIRSLEKQITKHEKKVQDFKNRPTVRPGMEHLPKEVIQQQQQRRIQHLETEIRAFKDNIRKIKRGEIAS